MGIVMGIDHGNGHVKARSNHRKINLPSVVARPYEEGVSYAAGENGSAIHNFMVEGAGAFLWGKDIVNNADITLATYGNRYKSNEFRLLSTFAISLLLPDNRMSNFDDVVVVTGYPSNEKGTRQEQELIEAFMGEHKVTVNNKNKQIRVSNVYALPQPLGTMMSLYLDDEGYVADASYETTYCGIIDIGSGTTDLDGINRLRRQNEDIGTIKRGVASVYRKIADRISVESDTTIQPTIQQVEQQILAGNTSYVHSERASVPMQKIIEEEFAQFTTYITNQIDQRWDRNKIAKFDRLILSGGGAASPHIAQAFREWANNDIVIVSNSQEANAAGFYRYGKFKTQEEA